MERKKDVILESFVLKGKGLDWLAVIYREEGSRLKAVMRGKLSGGRWQVVHWAGVCQKKLSREILNKFDGLSKSWGLSTLHIEYPGGIKEGMFIKGLREAKQESEAAIVVRKN
jgi:hypothetical protein